jgi:cation diffusion facilitator CzcD-associated flavoprotein CzcO
VNRRIGAKAGRLQTCLDHAQAAVRKDCPLEGLVRGSWRRPQAHPFFSHRRSRAPPRRSFCDIATNPEANAAAAAFIRSKIKEIVKNPETARKLTPTGLYAKRPLCNEGYYETFNRDNVMLVSVDENPIEAITPAGVRTADGVEHKLDVLVFATGFDAVDGNYRSMDLRGRGGRHINECWAAGPSSYLGLSIHGFPNLFMILGPNGPFTNLPPSIESQVEWISETIRHAESSGVATVEPSREAEDGWTKTCEDIANTTLFPKVESWIFGANIPGKKKTVMLGPSKVISQRHIHSRDSVKQLQTVIYITCI